MSALPDVSVGGRGKSAWPGGARFALFLSHDVDNFYPREIFRLLGELDHLRRAWKSGRRKRVASSARHIARSLVRPAPPSAGIARIIDVERTFGFRSTFFLLEDRAVGRLAGRYRYDEAEVKGMARLVQNSGCEIAVHGSYYALDDAAAYRAQADSFERAFGVRPAGIRNHYLHHEGVATWKAQAEAGFEYDASFGFRERAGVRDGRFLPFTVGSDMEGEEEGLLVLPLTIMDCAVLDDVKPDADRALSVCKDIAREVEAAGGLLTLLWHNDSFEEPRYAEREEVYAELLAWLRKRKPWCATGKEIAEWWGSGHAGSWPPGAARGHEEK